MRGHLHFCQRRSKQFHNAIWLCNSSALLLRSTDAKKPGHSPRLPGQVYSSLLEGMCVLTSDLVGNDILQTPVIL